MKLTSEGILTDVATRVATESLEWLPRGREAQAYLLETPLRVDKPTSAVGDMRWHTGALRRAAFRVREVFADAGYALAEVHADLPVPTRADWAHIAIAIAVKPGPRLRLGEVTMNDAPMAVPFEPGSWYSATRVGDLVATAQSQQDEEGHPLAEVSSKVVRRGEQIDVALSMTPGPLGFVRNVWLLDELSGSSTDGAAKAGLPVRSPFRRSLVLASMEHLARAHPDRDVGMMCKVIAMHEDPADHELRRLTRKDEVLVDVTFVLVAKNTELFDPRAPLSRCDIVSTPYSDVVHRPRAAP